MDDSPLDGTQYRWKPEHWFVVFWRETNIAAARWLAWGEFKHVTAFGYIEKADAWLFVDPRWKGIMVEVIPESMVDLRLAEWERGNLILRLRPTLAGSFPRFGLWCVPTIAHLVGCDSGALSPCGLLRHLRPRAIWERDGHEIPRRQCPEEGRRALPA